MRFAIILACTTLSTAAVVNPKPLVKRLDPDEVNCTDNCEGTFKANAGGECGDVDECISSCNGCYDSSMDVSRLLFNRSGDISY